MRYLIAWHNPKTGRHGIGRAQFTRRAANHHIAFLRSVLPDYEYRKVRFQRIPPPKPRECDTIPVRRTARHPMADGAYRSNAFAH